jgi:hypothetical protein
LGVRGIEPRLLNGLGELATAKRGTDDALTHHGQALELARRSEDRYEQARAHQGMATAHHVRGDETMAARHRDEARTLYRKLRVPIPAAVTGDRVVPDGDSSLLER